MGVFSVFQREHCPQVAEDEFFFFVFADDVKDLLVHCDLILLALVRHGVHLKQCNPFNPITYLYHHMSMFLISIRMSHLKTIATRLILLLIYIIYVNVLNFNKNVIPENNCNPFNPITYLYHYMSIFLISIRMSHLKTIATRLILLLIYIIICQCS